MNKTLLTVPEAARILNVTKNTVYRWIADGALPSFRIGRTIRIHPDAIDQMQHNANSEVMP